MSEIPQELDAFTKLWQFLGDLFGKSLPYKKGLDLERRINVILANQKEKFVPTNENIALFGDTIGDHSSLHRDDKKAREFGKRYNLHFKKRITPATQINANLDRYVEGLTRLLNQALIDSGDTVHKLFFSGTTLDFPEPVYPRDSIRWQVTNYEKHDGGIKLHISGANKQRVVIFQIPATLMKAYPTPTPINDPELFSEEFTYNIDQQKLDDYCRAMGEPPLDEIPWSLTTALATSALLEISEGEDGEPSGVNKGMQFEFYKRPHLGDINVRVFLRNEPKYFKSRDLYRYNFGAVCKQDGQVLAYSPITVLSEKQLKKSHKAEELKQKGFSSVGEVEDKRGPFFMEKTFEDGAVLYRRVGSRDRYVLDGLPWIDPLPGKLQNEAKSGLLSVDKVLHILAQQNNETN